MFLAADYTAQLSLQEQDFSQRHAFAWRAPRTNCSCMTHVDIFMVDSGGVNITVYLSLIGGVFPQLECLTIRIANGIFPAFMFGKRICYL